MDTKLNRIADLSPEKRAFLAKRLLSASGATPFLTSEPIAIIGIGCRFPGGANDPEAFWQLLYNGVDTITEAPAERYDMDAFYDPDSEAQGKTSTRWGSFLEQADRFDAAFFNISPREAMYMDPQQRLLLEVAWEALEDACQPIDLLAGSQTGVFVGVSGSDYNVFQYAHPDRLDMYSGTGCATNIVAGRLSYLLDLRGPCVAVDTACSSSLVAVHLACQSLRTGECRLALAGGVKLTLTSAGTTGLVKMHMLASDGRCKAFDARADGFVQGEGCGIVVLKRLSDARADGDPILALIRGSAINQDGRSASLTAPNVQAQQDLIRQALNNGGVDPTAISYVETHGTGTALGDPIEVEALTEVIGQPGPDAQPCVLGAVKTNLGHLEAAAGVAGLIKAVLALRHETIPPNLHFQNLNPHIALDGTRFVIPTTPRPWPSGEQRRYACVSSFGWSGTNANVVLEEAPQPIIADQDNEQQSDNHAYLLPLSARSAEGLRDLARAYQALLRAPDLPPLRDLAYTASLRRSHHPYRLTLVGATPQALHEQLAAFLAGEARPGLAHGHVAPASHPRLVFVFPGQGSQWLGMGQQLYAHEPAFRQSFDACAAACQPYLDASLFDQLYASDAPSRIDIIQPLLFALEVSLCALWRAWGVEPAAVIGHSMGEVAAAYVAGALTLADAARIICQRSRLLRRLSGQGAMATVELSLDAAKAALKGYESQVSIAVSNSLRSTVLAGEVAALEAIVAELERQQVFCRRVKVDVASHSPQMDVLAPELLHLLAEVQPQAAQLPIYSTVTSQVLEGSELKASYWMRNLREPVQFSTAVQQALAAGHTHFLEVSPHPILLPAIESDLRERGQAGVVLHSLRRGEEERAMLLGSLGQLYVSGYAVEWRRQYGEQGRCVGLPGNPWQRERYWLERGGRNGGGGGGAGGERRDHAVLGRRGEVATQAGTMYWEQRVSVGEQAYLAEHQVHGLVVVPGAVYLEWGLAGARALLGEEAGLAEVQFEQMLTLGAQEQRMVQVVVTREEPSGGRFEVLSRAAGEEQPRRWTLHSRGRFEMGTGRPAGRVELATVQGQCGTRIEGETYYEQLAARGLGYGASFQGVAEVWRQEGEALGRLRQTEVVREGREVESIHPALLDACFQVLDAAMPLQHREGTYLPVGVDRLRVYAPIGDEVWSYAQFADSSSDAAICTGDLFLLDGVGEMLAEVRGLRLQRLEGAQRDEIEDWLYELRWQPQERANTAISRSADEHGQWLIFADTKGFGTTLADRLKASGATCVVVTPGTGPMQGQAGQYQVDPTRPDTFRQLLQATCGGTHPACRNVVFLWGLEPTEAAEPSAADLMAAQSWGVESVPYLVQALVQAGWRDAPRLWLVTCGTQAVERQDEPMALVTAPLWGLGRTLMYEHPELRCTLIDLSSAEPATDMEELVAELWAQEVEDQVVLRMDGRYVARLARYAPAEPDTAPRSSSRALTPAGEQPFRLEIAHPGVLDQLTLRATSCRLPEPGEVEIQVEAVGLNFLDVLSALGAIPDDAPGAGQAGPRLGGECAGRVVALGAGVDNFELGQEVVALTQGCFATHVTASQLLVAPKPTNLSFEQAAMIPLAFLTAYYALYHVGHLMKGERVLIHAAAGGVGLAAVQLAQRVGAEVFATADSPEKRAFLHTLGVEHVLDSRSFVEDVRRLTGGEGVDVVLNSLSGEFISHSFALLRDHGRFIELGKRASYEDRKLDLQPFLKNLTFSLVDLRAMMYQRPAVLQTLLHEATQLFASGALTPSRYEVYPIAHVQTAFHAMAQGKHIGNIIVTLQDREQALITPPMGSAGIIVRAEGTYVISGGLGGIGLQVARWLVGQGARHLLLLGRRGPTPAAQEVLAELSAAGARVQVAQVDVAQREALAEVLEQAARTLPALRGVFHAAAVLDDGTILQLTPARFPRVMAPKLAGAWNLHTLTRQQPLDYFVLFSSAASMIGSPGQANYAAANAFLDTLAHYRRACGLPAVSINWGPWAEVGLAAAQANRGERLGYRGMGSMTPPQGLTALGRLLQREVEQAAVLPLNLRQWRQYYAKMAASPLFSHLAQEQDRLSAAQTTKSSLHEALLAAEPGQRRVILEAHLRDQIAQVLQFDPALLAADTAFPSLGFDSLMSIEFRNRLETSLGLTLPTTLVWGYPTINALATHLAERIGISLDAVEEAVLDSEQEPVTLTVALTNLEELSDDEAEALLLERLDTVEKRGLK